MSAVSYHPSGQLAQIVRANGELTDITLNDRQWVAELLHHGIAEARYQYDTLGNVLEITDPLRPGEDRGFGYDALNRLTSAQGRFQAVEALGRYWVSRVRDRRYVKLGSESDWRSVNSLHPQATATPKAMGEVELARSQAHLCQLVIYKGKAKGRHEINRYGKRSRSQRSNKAARAAREPWILAANLPAGHKLPIAWYRSIANACRSKRASAI